MSNGSTTFYSDVDVGEVSRLLAVIEAFRWEDLPGGGECAGQLVHDAQG